jgi:hypothetical protein
MFIPLRPIEQVFCVLLFERPQHQPERTMKSNTVMNVESLERRLVLNGAVSAVLLGNDLIINGDAEDNQITITQPTAGALRIAGSDNTTINGNPSLDVPQFAGNLIIQMQEGGEDQVVAFGPLNLPHDLRARITAGQLVVEGSEAPLTIGGNLTVRMGKNGTAILRNDVATAGQVSIDAGEVNFVGGHATLPDFAAARFDNGLKIDNPYFPVVPGTVYKYHIAGIDDETGEPVTQENTVRVLSDTRTILGVKVRVVNDRVFEDGHLIEDTNDWYAQDNNGNVWYFGEGVTNYEYDDNGNLIDTNHDGSWEAGTGGSHPGVIMEARPRVGHRYFQEFSPNNVMDWGEGLARGQTATVPAGKFTGLFRTEESSVMEPFSLADKLYAPGVGTIAEFELDIEDNEVMETVSLVSLTLNGKPVKQVVSNNGFNGVNAGGRFIGGANLAGPTALNTRGPIVINGSTFHDDLSARAGDALILVDSNLDDAVLGTTDTLTLRRVVSDGTIRVTANPDEVNILDSRLSSVLSQFARGNNTLNVSNSSIGSLQADGGTGKNIFHDGGSNDFGKLRLRRFVKA